MRRWLTILLLVCMPLQFSIAAVNAYCGHETGSTAQHGEHNDHQHTANAPDGGGADSEPFNTIDTDAAGCHPGGSAAIFGSMHLPAVNPAPSTTRIGYAMRALSPPPLAPPERPKWAALA